MSGIYPAGAPIVNPLTGAEFVDVDGGGAVFVRATTAQIANLAGKATAGTFVINGVTPVTVANAAVTANSVVLITLKTPGGTVGAVPAIQTITAGTGFTVLGTAADTSTYNYRILG